MSMCHLYPFKWHLLLKLKILNFQEDSSDTGVSENLTFSFYEATFVNIFVKNDFLICEY